MSTSDRGLCFQTLGLQDLWSWEPEMEYYRQHWEQPFYLSLLRRKNVFEFLAHNCASREKISVHTFSVPWRWNLGPSLFLIASLRSSRASCQLRVSEQHRRRADQDLRVQGQPLVGEEYLSRCDLHAFVTHADYSHQRSTFSEEHANYTANLDRRH